MKQEQFEDKESFFLSELLLWNKKINLVSKKAEKELFIKHLPESYFFIENIFSNKTLLDVGSGNGFPSIPIAISRPKTNVFCVESNQKKTIFLSSIKKKLLLENVTILNKNIENLDLSYYNFFDYIIARGFSSPKEIVKKTIKYAKSNAKYFFYNVFCDNDLDGVKSLCGIAINIVDKHVHKLPSGLVRVLYTVTFVKETS